MKILIAVVAAFLVLPPHGVADARPTRAKAEQVLAAVRQLQAGQGVKTGHELSPALNQLYESLPSLARDDRHAAEAILVRPDDARTDPDGTHKWSGPEAGGSPVCGSHFCVHWTAAGADASNQPYAQAMLDIFEDEVYPCENGTETAACAGSPGLGWRDPVSDAPAGGNEKVDVYVADLFTGQHIFGYVALDPDQPQDAGVPHVSYMVMDNDYSRFGNGTPEEARTDEQVTAAHEYNHVLQNAYDYLQDTWMFEATAVYMEDKVYPAVNDYLNYVDAWVANPKQPLTAFSSVNLKPYGSAVWNHWVDHRFGASVVRAAWEQSVAAANFAPGSYGIAITAAGGAGFQDEFGRFAAAVAEWQAPGSGFPDRYPDLPRDGLLPTETRTAPFALPHTTFAFFDVPIPATAPPRIRLTVALPTGTSGGIALVGRTGLDSTAGEVTSNFTPMPAGGLAAVELADPARFGRITAVVVNADPSRVGFDPSIDDYIFTRDVPDAVALMSEPGVPIPVTGPASPIADHRATVTGSVDPHMGDSTWFVQYGQTARYGSSTDVASVAATVVGSPPVSAELDDLKANATYHYRLVASNAAGTTAGSDMTFKTARDVTKPRVVVKVKPQRTGRVRRDGLIYLARCSEHCLGTAELRISRTLARRLGLPVVLGKGRVNLAARPRSSTLRIRLSQRARRQFTHLSRGFAATLRFNVADDARNRVTLRRSARLSSSRQASG